MIKFNIKHFNTKILTMACLAVFSSQTAYSMEDKNNENNILKTQNIVQTQQKKQTSIKMYPHTFHDVQGQVRKVTVSFPYPYKTIDPTKTRLFFEGEVLLIDPETTPFETFVTRPLLPCLFGRIFDPVTKRSLVIHKAAVQDMKSILPFFKEFAPSDVKNLDVTLYTCQLSENQFKGHSNWYGGKTQIQEMNAVRDFLSKDLSIPENNIERRFLNSTQYLNFSKLGQYEGTPITVGVTKTGEVFNTSPFTVDLYGLYDVPFPPNSQEKNIRTTPINGQALLNMGFIARVDNIIFPMIREHFVGITQKNRDSIKYWTKPFFSAKELNVPASEIAKMFKIKFGKEEGAFDMFSMMSKTNRKTEATNPFLNSN